MNKKALITGITGQDGAYLAHHLLQKGYSVIGTSRDIKTCNMSKLIKLGISRDVEIISMAPSEFKSVLKAVSVTDPDEIYNLAGQSSVGLSFEQPLESIESISKGTLNLLEAIRRIEKDIKCFNAGSSECFGGDQGTAATETTPFRPRSPYAAAKAAAFWLTVTFREAYKLNASTGILANHESPLRPDCFVTKKIINGVREIKKGNQKKLSLGNLNVWRDWGWAPDYAEAMHLILQAEGEPDDYIIASGKTTSLLNFVEIAFEVAEIKMEDHLETIPSKMRPNDPNHCSLDPSKINKGLGWKTNKSLKEIIENIYHEILF